MTLQRYEDRRLAEQDAVFYGNAFIKRGEDGLVRRIDPSTIQVSEASSTG